MPVSFDDISQAKVYISATAVQNINSLLATILETVYTGLHYHLT